MGQKYLSNAGLNGLYINICCASTGGNSVYLNMALCSRLEVLCVRIFLGHSHIFCLIWVEKYWNQNTPCGFGVLTLTDTGGKFPWPAREGGPKQPPGLRMFIKASLWLFLIIFFIGAVRLVIIDHLEEKIDTIFFELTELLSLLDMT